MRIAISLILIVLMKPAQSWSAEPCRKIHGRAILYRADGFFQIWQVGTHHVYFPADKASADLVCQTFDCNTIDTQPTLFADFTICPTEPYKAGAAQAVIVKRVQHPHVVADWARKAPR